MRPIHRLIEEAILRWARRELSPLHPAIPAIVRRLNHWESAPSPLDPADSIVTGFCIVAGLFLLAMGLYGELPGGAP